MRDVLTTLLEVAGFGAVACGLALLFGVGAGLVAVGVACLVLGYGMAK